MFEISFGYSYWLHVLQTIVKSFFREKEKEKVPQMYVCCPTWIESNRTIDADEMEKRSNALIIIIITIIIMNKPEAWIRTTRYISLYLCVCVCLWWINEWLYISIPISVWNVLSLSRITGIEFDTLTQSIASFVRLLCYINRKNADE